MTAVVTSALIVASLVAVAPLAAEASAARRGEIFSPNQQPAGAPRVTVPGGFQDSIAWSGFTLPRRPGVRGERARVHR